MQLISQQQQDDGGKKKEKEKVGLVEYSNICGLKKLLNTPSWLLAVLRPPSPFLLSKVKHSIRFHFHS